MSNTQHFLYFIIFIIGLSLTVAFGVWWFEPSHIANNFHGLFHGIDIFLFLLLSYVVWYQITNELFMWVVAHGMKHPQQPMKPQKDLRVAFLTAFVPGTEPMDMLEKTLKAMIAVDYPHETWLLDEGDDEKVKKLCKKYNVWHYSRKGIAKYNLKHGPYTMKTKGGNYNSWYDKFGRDYEFVAQIDVDFIPKKNFLMKTLGYFQDPEVAFVGSPQVYGNTKDSWITKGAAEQAYGFYGSMQKGFFGSDMQLFIGANHVVRVAAHNSIGGYAGHIVEDHLTGMKFYSKKWKSVYVPEILAVGEGPATWDAYFSQQMRWAYGLIHILFTKSPTIFRKMKMKHIVNYFLLQQYYFYGLAQVIGIVLLSLYFLFGIQSTIMAFLPLLVLYVPLLLWQQVIFIWLQKYNIDPKNESGLMLRAKLLNYAAWPIYFLAFAGVILGKRLTYKVTPKGKQQKTDTSFWLFLPHFILGSITIFDLVVGFYLHHDAMQLVFWAVANTCFMYFFVINVFVEKVYKLLRSIRVITFFSSKLEFTIPKINFN